MSAVATFALGVTALCAIALYARCVKTGASHISIAQLTSVASSYGLRDTAHLGWREQRFDGHA
jgi:hypothetical protein